MRTIKIALLALLILSVSNVFAAPLDGSRQKAKIKSPAATTSWVETTLASLTLDEKIGQLIIPATVGMFLTDTSEAYQQMRRDITEFHVGGYHLLGDVTAMHEPAGVALLLNQLQQSVKVPLWSGGTYATSKVPVGVAAAVTRSVPVPAPAVTSVFMPFNPDGTRSDQEIDRTRPLSWAMSRVEAESRWRREVILDAGCGRQDGPSVGSSR